MGLMDEQKTKRCSTCGLEKGLTGFNKRRKSKDGFQARCKDCARRDGEARRQTNKTKNHFLGEAVYTGVKKCSVCAIEKPRTEFYRARAQLDGFSYLCKVCSASTQSSYLRKQKEVDPQGSWLKKALSSARRRAKKGGRKFNLTFEDLILHLPTHCPVFGTLLDYAATKNRRNSPTLDRHDNSKGYTSDNVVVMSWWANSLKNDGSLEEFEAIVKHMKLVASLETAD